MSFTSAQSQKMSNMHMVSWSVVHLFVFAVCFTRTVWSQVSTCPQVSSIPVQSSFDFDRFAGKSEWNVILYNKIVPIEGLDMPVNKSDLSFFFSRNSSDTMTVIIAGRVRLAPTIAFCLKLEGIADNLVGSPGKLQQNYFNPLTKKLFTFNFWVLHTDYKNLAVVYACQRPKDDGTCGPNDTYLWTLSRAMSHTPAEMKTIKDVGSSVCMDVTHLRHVGHKSPCPTS